MAEEQGLPGWADARFKEDYATYRKFFEEAEAAKDEKMAGVWQGMAAMGLFTVGGLAALGIADWRESSRRRAKKAADKRSEPEPGTPGI